MLLANGLQIAPQALAEVTPQLAESYWYQDGGALQLEHTYALYGEIYRSEPWVAAVVNKRADAIARLPMHVWSDDGPTRLQVTPAESGYAKLIAQPCYYLDSYTFWSWVATTYDIYGETYLAIVFDDNGIPVTLMPMHPSRVAVRRDPDTGKHEYLFMAGNALGTGLVKFGDGEVVPIRSYNPAGTERGLSKMEPLRSTIFAEDSSRTADAAMKTNGGRPNVVLSTDKVLGPDGKKRLRDSWNQAHAGSSNAGKALVLEDGVTASPVQLTSVELQMIEARHLNREEICAVYDVAPPMVHDLTRATFSNIASQMRAFYRDTMAPVIERFESAFDFYVGQFFDPKLAVRFDDADVTRGDFEQRATSAQALVVIGALTPNEARELMGFGRFKDAKADKLYANSAQQPLGEPTEQIRLTGEVLNDPDGIAVAPPGPTTDVPAIAGGTHQIPQLTAPSAKAVRDLKAEVGRGKSIAEAARALAQKSPDDLNDIAAAVLMAMAEQRKK
ncbi:phage portal protein [Gordonia sp. L191]|uniref:phage portal protein n=1 Tax=Gordonia sp. L191 TaxID=2982699 RepID=UPI0024BFD614|nr:phage portal protein [Gordonia sp. L191]WHU45120.1 phage portal protein [Gordonia sp. L191]